MSERTTLAGSIPKNQFLHNKLNRLYTSAVIEMTLAGVDIQQLRLIMRSSSQPQQSTIACNVHAFIRYNIQRDDMASCNAG
ncbi:hypothetical protein DAPPUDRAFT_237291 [Daphnia pulex]|uniref:Uncharacterized protein n=1 Tax=Daphnia pulex TaxID=6669 RepID=E9G3J8_DAPPU|nr:hypothetical protein DAPPUDRAFT_237291 [Daphnia pulex]|eukprot:EFX85784.1 hypothetical protein DAPPUDRAFT_237291 [Daphnia pulex]